VTPTPQSQIIYTLPQLSATIHACKQPDSHIFNNR
jgi:hypothetical protein